MAHKLLDARPFLTARIITAIVVAMSGPDFSEWLERTYFDREYHFKML